MDGIDAALVDFEPSPLKLISYRQFPVGDQIKQVLRSGELLPIRLGQIDVALGLSFSAAVKALLNETGIDPSQIIAIGSHGQTILHGPNAPHPFSLQLGDPNIIANETGIQTVGDFRRRDLAAGGQGAPLAPGFHEHMFRHADVDRAVVNIGGIANITILPAARDADVLGFDSGPGNTLLDAWAREHLGEPFDTDGRWARSGNVDLGLMSKLLADPYLQQQGPKSTGPEHYNVLWLKKIIDSSSNAISAQDTQATLVHFTAETITRALLQHTQNCREVLISGGGVHNGELMSVLSDLLTPRLLASTADYGLDPDAVEACAFAWLAKRRLEKKPGNMPSVTGADKSVILGAVYSG